MKKEDKTISINKETGRVYTPDYIVDNILDLSGYYGKSILKKHVIDNSCGDGAFLCRIVDRYCSEALKNNYKVEKIKKELSAFVHGIEIDMIERNKCIYNLSKVAASYGVNDVSWDVICADTLSITDYNEKMDFVLGNPPYVRVHNFGENFDKIKNFFSAQQGMTDLFIVFFEIGIKMLSENGILGYITPSSYFNSLAGSYIRDYLTKENLIKCVLDLKHYQAFDATTYTAITILKKGKSNTDVEYYQFDERNRIPYYKETLKNCDYYIANNFYFTETTDLKVLRSVFGNTGKSDISVKNGFATLCDSVFINDFDFDSKYIIPVIKSSRGITKRIIFPYDKSAQLLSEEELKSEKDLYNYLLKNKDKLTNRSIEKGNTNNWYAYGRSQAISDTYKTKLTINTLIRDEEDLKCVFASSGVGVYSGLYIISETIDYNDIIAALKSKEFVSFIKNLGKYKSGGYYTFSSKDVKSYLDYVFAYEKGLYDA